MERTQKEAYLAYRELSFSYAGLDFAEIIGQLQEQNYEEMLKFYTYIHIIDWDEIMETIDSHIAQFIWLYHCKYISTHDERKEKDGYRCIVPVEKACEWIRCSREEYDEAMKELVEKGVFVINDGYYDITTVVYNYSA